MRKILRIIFFIALIAAAGYLYLILSVSEGCGCSKGQVSHYQAPKDTINRPIVVK